MLIIMKNKRLILILAVASFLLLIPIIAMLFTSEVNWTLSDFIIAAVLLLGAGLTIEIIFRKVKGHKYRIVLFVLLLVVFFLIWAELAVGIFGTPLSGN